MTNSRVSPRPSLYSRNTITGNSAFESCVGAPNDLEEYAYDEAEGY